MWLALRSLSEGGTSGASPGQSRGTGAHVTTKPSMGNRDVLYKSGVYARKALCLPVGRQVLPREVSHVHRLWVVLRGEQSTLTAWEPPSPFRLWRAKEVSPGFCGMDGGHSR